MLMPSGAGRDFGKTGRPDPGLQAQGDLKLTSYNASYGKSQPEGARGFDHRREPRSGEGDGAGAGRSWSVIGPGGSRRGRIKRHGGTGTEERRGSRSLPNRRQR